MRAAVAQRALLGGVLVLDESLDLNPTAQPAEGDMEVTGRVSLLPSATNGEEQVDYDEVSLYRSILLSFIFIVYLLGTC